MAHERVDLTGVEGLREVRAWRSGGVIVVVGQMPEPDGRWFAQHSRKGLAYCWYLERQACNLADRWLRTSIAIQVDTPPAVVPVSAPKLTAVQRMQAAHLAGAIQRIAAEHPTLDAQAMAVIWEITRDPEVLGHALGDCLVNAEDSPEFQACADLLRACGAEEGAAARKVAWRRWEAHRRSSGDRML